MRLNEENLQQIGESVWCKVYPDKDYVAAYYGGDCIYIYNGELDQISKVELEEDVRNTAEYLSDTVYGTMEGLPNENFKEKANEEVSRIRGMESADLDDF